MPLRDKNACAAYALEQSHTWWLLKSFSPRTATKTRFVLASSPISLLSQLGFHIRDREHYSSQAMPFRAS
ncbi:hypothetical protein F7734_23745 [Scytonema sp. UIC 10036]|uniref:hypothetical protein n=1 Tax=Scytonema sp. UIC 10036 TaxID=2304196 RepID=UPI0012DA0368|nr:hypothetical protein [Scytonema sp. UIC 10036]MUG95207.1 hypothetical protein [Scytonema sp. UIC 10036]